MKLPKIPLAQTVVKLCELKEIKHIVISPGSRNAPLTIGFTNHPYFRSYSIVDERSAGFFALGIAQQIKKPVVLVCTSGSALLNYFPAVAEAYYSDVPLVILSADRPEHLIGIGDGQTINQNQVFANHILYEAALKEDLNSTGDQKTRLSYNETEINNAINVAITQRGPVHLNVPFNEPLYDLVDAFNVQPKSIEPGTLLSSNEFDSEFVEAWNSSKRKLVLIGVNNPNEIDRAIISLFANDPSVIVFTETTSNVHHQHFFPSIDKIIAPLNEVDFEQLQPEMLITVGGMIVSKKIKAFLRNYSPETHYHIDDKKAYDTFFNLTGHIRQNPNNFFKGLLNDLRGIDSDYRTHWNNIKQLRDLKHIDYLNQIPFCDLKAFNAILESIPDNSLVQSGNSSAIRYMQLFNINKTWEVYCNRGTSGIDGSTSTAIGASVVSNNQTILITGDLSFFYDSNALWNNYIPKNFRIIVVNNGGGGIFRILPGHKNTENFDTFFETKHDLNAKALCEMYQLEYSEVKDLASLNEQLSNFYVDSEKPRLLEVFTPRKINDEILLNYFDNLR